MKTNHSRLDKGVCLDKRVIAQNGVLAFQSSGDQIDFSHLKTIVELYPSYHLGQVVTSAQPSPFLLRALSKFEHHVQHAITVLLQTDYSLWVFWFIHFNKQFVCLLSIHF